MVTLRSAVSDRQRVTWSTGGVKVAPGPENNNRNPAPRTSTSDTNMAKEKRQKKAVSTRTTSPQMTTRSMAAVDAREAAPSNNEPNLSGRQNKVPNNKPKSKKKELVLASPRQITTRSMKKLLAPVKKSLTVSSTGKKKVAVKDKKSTTSAPTRRSNRIAHQVLSNINVLPQAQDNHSTPPGDINDPIQTIPAHNAPVSHDEAPIAPDQSIHSSMSTGNEGNNAAAPIVQEDHENGSGPDGTVQDSSADTETMQSYMAAIRRRIDALETRELLVAAVNAPYWSDELHRDLLKEVVKAWSAISVGRFKDINEVVQLPLEHTYWNEEIRVTQNALRDARRYYDGLKQEAIDQEDEEMEEGLQ